MSHRVVLIPGDWVGPETCRVVQDIFEAAGPDIDWDEQNLDPGPVPDALVDRCREAGSVLLAKMRPPKEPGQLPATVQLRKKLGLWGTVRPVTALPRSEARFPDIDVVVVRETSEDIYSGFEHTVTDGVFEAVKVTTRSASERIARFAFETARARGRKKVTVVHKSNIMKKSDGLFLATAREVADDYDDIEVGSVIVDALCMQLLRWPDAFDVLLTGNLFGDIVSDLASGMAGGITAAPSASFGDDGHALFENPHGRAPDLVGSGQTNPIPMLRPALMLLDHLGESEAARRIDTAMRAVLRDGVRTPDMGGDATTLQVRDAIIAAL